MSAQTLHGAMHVEVAGRRDVVEFRADGGRLGSTSGSPVLLLSWLTQTSPLYCFSDADDPDVVSVLASGPGADRDTSWLRSELSRPDDLSSRSAARRCGRPGDACSSANGTRVSSGTATSRGTNASPP